MGSTEDWTLLAYGEGRVAIEVRYIQASMVAWPKVINIGFLVRNRVIDGGGWEKAELIIEENEVITASPEYY